MNQRVSVLFVHGVNTEGSGYHHSMQQGLEAALPRRLRGRVDYVAVNWSSRLRDRQLEYLSDAKAEGGIRDYPLRRAIVHAFGDASAFHKPQDYKASSYYEIMSIVRGGLEELETKHALGQPLVFIGHSAGCHILQSFIWDTFSIGALDVADVKPEQKAFYDYLQSRSVFCRLGTLAGVVTMGCNDVLFRFPIGRDRLIPLTHARHEGGATAISGSGTFTSYKGAGALVELLQPKRSAGIPAQDQQWRLQGSGVHH